MILLMIKNSLCMCNYVFVCLLKSYSSLFSKDSHFAVNLDRINNNRQMAAVMLEIVFKLNNSRRDSVEDSSCSKAWQQCLIKDLPDKFGMKRFKGLADQHRDR